MQKGFATVIVIAILLIIAAVGAGAYYFGKTSSQPAPSLTSNQPTPTPDETADWKVYENTTYNFSFKYPNSWKEITTDEDKGRGNLGNTNRELVIETDKKEIITATVFDGKADKSGNKEWEVNLDISNNKSVLLTYVQCQGPGCLGGQKDLAIFNQILSTFKFLGSELTSAPTSTVPAIENQIAFIKKVYTTSGKNYVDLDYIQWIDCQDCMDGYSIKNQNSQIRSFEVAIDAKISNLEGIGVSPHNDLTFAQLKEIFDSTASDTEWLRNAPYDVAISKNIVVSISQRYRP